MKLMRQDEAQAKPNGSPIFIGEVVSQQLVTENEAHLLRVTAVTFRNGARNRLHHHAADQVLVVTRGRGIVATAREELHVGPGDVIIIPAGERHWHGAAPGHDLTHLSILTPGALTIDEP